MRTIKNLDKLQIGHDYKYKELCSLFEEEVKTHYSRDAQLKDWACFFRWTHPLKQKYHIEEIYVVPRQKIDGRKNNGGNSRSKYLALDDIIMEYVSDGEEAAHTLPQFAVELGILTEQYRVHRNNIKDFCEQNNYSFELVSTFFDKLKETVLDNIESAFERLSNEGFLEVRTFMALILASGEKVELFGDDVLRVIELENNVCEQMGIKRFEAYKDEYSQEYKSRINVKIFEEFGYETRYHYKLYKIKKYRNDYTTKSTDDKWRLSRKFVINIGLYLLKFACAYSSENVVTNPKTGEDFCIDYELEAISSDIIKHIIELTNCFFSYINPISWDEFWNDGELNMRNEDKAMLFWSQYCLVDMNNKIKQCFVNREQKQVKETKRELFVAEFSEEIIVEWEHILGKIDFEKCYIDEEYTEKCSEALKAYYDLKTSFCYAKDEHIEEYCVYVARLIMQHKKSEQIPFYEYVKQFEKTAILQNSQKL